MQLNKILTRKFKIYFFISFGLAVLTMILFLSTIIFPSKLNASLVITFAVFFLVAAINEFVMCIIFVKRAMVEYAKANKIQ
ncbi:MAG: hypothetical protein ACRC5M_03295 [Anaeroplasmataceae bacterium]